MESFRAALLYYTVTTQSCNLCSCFCCSLSSRRSATSRPVQAEQHSQRSRKGHSKMDVVLSRTLDTVITIISLCRWSHTPSKQLPLIASLPRPEASLSVVAHFLSLPSPSCMQWELLMRSADPCITTQSRQRCGFVMCAVLLGLFLQR